ncbi:MAG: DNA mismatch repair protein MutS [Chitinispirillia bacterium]|nr:DNA mismatch repair protein MutS [Chitinispirillia bacterium]MCL2269236.1 DNA mismatch repair protein MutS [Chitinispirillia bacterium]
MKRDPMQISFFPDEGESASGSPVTPSSPPKSVKSAVKADTPAKPARPAKPDAPAVKLTPLMRQYNEIKAKNQDTLLLYRMGDFYEFFDEDARIAAKILGITLTSRYQGGIGDTQLAGFPHHALDRYANKLVRAGHKIAICEQIEDPKQAKGIVKRDVVEVITAGTATDDNFIEERVNNFIAAVCYSQKPGVCGLAVCDLSTGFFQIEEMDNDAVEHELVRVDPGEILVSADQAEHIQKYVRSTYRQIYISKYDGWKFDVDTATEAITKHFDIASVQSLGLEGLTDGVRAAGALIRYLKEQKKSDLRHITSIAPRLGKQFAELDPSTIRNLELFQPMQSDDTEGALISVLDSTGTSLGARLLRRWLAHPLRSVSAINERLDCVEWFKSDTFVRGESELFLKSIADLERLISRVTFERANGRDLNALKRSFETFPNLQKIIGKCEIPLIRSICADLSGFENLASRIASTLVDDPPLSVREGKMIRDGFSQKLDDIRDIRVNGKQWIARMEATERQRTGISSLKVAYNKVFGYYIEITKANMSSVPKDYIRKQTLSTGERYITPELKDMEDKILGAEEKLNVIEYDIFIALRREVASHCERIQKAAAAISALDVFVSLARIAAENAYCRPVLDEGAGIVIKEGRHPVVEKLCAGEQFVPNDTELLSGDSQIALITGPNMAGKSTYLRQTALIAIMAQMGSFVPAASAHIGIVDKFFTRVGASDRLARGQSTFLVEMIEVANILNNATDKSFVLLDEVGRGTSTFDGISIAWAVAEYLHETKGRAARTLFATHYHELTEMPLIYSRIRNLHVKVKEWNDKIIFLRKIDTGSCDHSYGIQVARLAGVPASVIVRAKEILNNLENMELTPDRKPVLARKKDGSFDLTSSSESADGVQLNIIDEYMQSIVTRLKTLDINALAPIDALNVLYELRKKAMDG